MAIMEPVMHGAETHRDSDDNMDNGLDAKRWLGSDGVYDDPSPS